MGISKQIYQAVVLCVAIRLSYLQQNDVDEDGYFYYQGAEYPKDCQDVISQCTDPGGSVSGVYIIKPEGYEKPFEVYCDHDTDGGGWTVFQRRIDNTVSFGRPWDSYKDGFGFLSKEFWMGNEKLAYLTNQRTYRLRINMTLGDGSEIYAEYDQFRITDKKKFYELVHLGSFSGTVGTPDQMRSQLNKPFSTYDQASSSNCPTRTNNAGGWWFNEDQCSHANLNGDKTTGSGHPQIHWDNNVAVQFAEMKVKPVATS